MVDVIKHVLYAIYRLVTAADGAVREVLELAIPDDIQKKLINGTLPERYLPGLIDKIEYIANLYAHSRYATNMGPRTLNEVSTNESMKYLASTWACFCSVYGKALQALIIYWVNGRAGRNLVVEGESKYLLTRSDNSFIAWADMKVSHKNAPDYAALLEVKASLRKSSVAEVALDHPEGTYLICTSKNIRDIMIRRAVAEGMTVVVVGGYPHPDVISMTEMMEELKELFDEAVKDDGDDDKTFTT